MSENELVRSAPKAYSSQVRRQKNFQRGNWKNKTEK